MIQQARYYWKRINWYYAMKSVDISFNINNCTAETGKRPRKKLTAADFDVGETHINQKDKNWDEQEGTDDPLKENQESKQVLNTLYKQPAYQTT